MSDSTNLLDQVTQNAIEREALINALLAECVGLIFGRRDSTSAGLAFGYYGGRFNGTAVANGTVTATNSATNYVVVHRTTLVVSISTATTNWNDTTTYGRMYLLVASGGTIASYEDHRDGTNGIFEGGGAGGGAPTSAKYLVRELDGTLTNESVLTAGNNISLTESGGSPPTAYTIASKAPVVIQAACSDELTELTAGTGKLSFRLAHALTLTEVRASLKTPVSGSPTGDLVVDINENGTTILSTKLTIDSGEKTSTTAATPAVISDANLADDSEITVDIDSVGAGAIGLKITLIGWVP